MDAKRTHSVSVAVPMGASVVQDVHGILRTNNINNSNRITEKRNMKVVVVMRTRTVIIGG